MNFHFRCFYPNCNRIFSTDKGLKGHIQKSHTNRQKGAKA